MIDAIVLAAGASSRMGSPKALLLAPDGRSFLARVVSTLFECGFERTTVVTGTHHEAIERLCVDASIGLRVRLVRNPDPSRGQLSSLLVGMEAAVHDRTEALLVTLVDVPMVAGTTVTSVVDRWRRTRAPIVRPMNGGAHGHPVVFDREVFDALRTASLDVGAKAVVRAYADRIENVSVDDSGCVTDVDTTADYAQLRASATRGDH